MKLTNSKKDKDKDLPGYKPYPDNEDIYSRDKETEIDPDKLQENSVNSGSELNDDIMKKTEVNPGNDLDVPGSELDDEEEAAGNEDEENNYYSLGGDDHSDLDEDDSTKQ